MSFLRQFLFCYHFRKLSLLKNIIVLVFNQLELFFLKSAYEFAVFAAFTNKFVTSEYFFIFMLNVCSRITCCIFVLISSENESKK